MLSEYNAAVRQNGQVSRVGRLPDIIARAIFYSKIITLIPPAKMSIRKHLLYRSKFFELRSN